MKILLIVPENSYRIKQFLDASISLNLETYFATDSTFAPPDLDERVFDSIEFCNPDVAGTSINRIVEENHIDTVIAIDEGGVEVLEWAKAQAKGLPRPLDRSLALRDKEKLRMVLGAVVPQPKLFKRTDPLEFANQSYVVKPSKGSASIGVSRVRSPEELEAAIHLIETKLGQYGHAIVEEYIDGSEYAFEGMVVNGSLVELALFDKPHPLIGPYFPETIYVTPSALSDPLKKKVFQTIEAACRQLGIENGPVHVEVRITDDLKVVIIDFANRSIGGRCSSALSFVGDRTLEVVLLEAITEGNASNARRENQYSGVFMIPVAASGVIADITGVEEAKRIPFVTDIVIDAKVGNHYEELPSVSSYLGFIYAKAPTRALCIEALEKSFSLIDFLTKDNQ